MRDKARRGEARRDGRTVRVAGPSSSGPGRTRSRASASVAKQRRNCAASVVGDAAVAAAIASATQPWAPSSAHCCTSPVTPLSTAGVSHLPSVHRPPLSADVTRARSWQNPGLRRTISGTKIVPCPTKPSAKFWPAAPPAFGFLAAGDRLRRLRGSADGERERLVPRLDVAVSRPPWIGRASRSSATCERRADLRCAVGIAEHAAQFQTASQPIQLFAQSAMNARPAGGDRDRIVMALASNGAPGSGARTRDIA
eukprot:COSAG06_NODE_676_length_13150_cov_3.664164_16_plen_254_part_00